MLRVSLIAPEMLGALGAARHTCFHLGHARARETVSVTTTHHLSMAEFIHSRNLELRATAWKYVELHGAFGPAGTGDYSGNVVCKQQIVAASRRPGRNCGSHGGSIGR